MRPTSMCRFFYHWVIWRKKWSLTKQLKPISVYWLLVRLFKWDCRAWWFINFFYILFFSFCLSSLSVHCSGVIIQGMMLLKYNLNNDLYTGTRETPVLDDEIKAWHAENNINLLVFSLNVLVILALSMLSMSKKCCLCCFPARSNTRLSHVAWWKMIVGSRLCFLLIAQCCRSFWHL